MNRYNWMLVRVAGEVHPHGHLTIDANARASCGTIRNGLAAYWSNDQRAPESFRGTPATPSFVIDFDDLEKVYLAAKAARERESTS